MSQEDYTCSHRLRVRWSEVDMQKIVFNSNYLNYIDVAIAEYWRAEPDPSERPLITAVLVYVNADPETTTSAPLPVTVRELIAKFEHTPLQ